MYRAADGRIVVVEAKGGTSPLGSRRLPGGDRAQQGTIEYLRETVRIMLLRGGPDEKRIAQLISSDWSKVEYYIVRQAIKDGELKDVVVKQAKL